MAFWTYMLLCADGSFYVGHTDDLGRRMSQHNSGEIKGYTSSRLPVRLVWSECFQTRIEALGAERRIKGWSRAKKRALIRGDWTRISALAMNSERRRQLGFDRLSPSGSFLQQGTDQ